MRTTSETKSSHTVPAERPVNPAITRLLNQWATGDREALRILIPLVIVDLQQIARRLSSRRDLTRPTALVNEVFIRLWEGKPPQWIDGDTQNCYAFYALAAKTIRNLLVDRDRARGRLKRGGGLSLLSLQEILLTAEHPLTEAELDRLIDVNTAIRKLEKLNARAAQVTALRFLVGLAFDEIAQTLSISSATAKRDWDAAKLWLQRELRTGVGH